MWQNSIRLLTGPNIALFDRAFPFVMGPKKSPNPDHAVNGFYKKTHCYTLFCGKMPIPYRNINNPYMGNRTARRDEASLSSARRLIYIPGEVSL